MVGGHHGLAVEEKVTEGLTNSPSVTLFFIVRIGYAYIDAWDLMPFCKKWWLRPDLNRAPHHYEYDKAPINTY